MVHRPDLGGDIGAGDASSAYMIRAVVPNDGADLPDGLTRGLLVGTAGNAKITDAANTEVAGVPLQAGYNPLRVRRVWATGLTAANIFALY